MSPEKSTNHLPEATYSFAPYNHPVMSKEQAVETLRATGGWIIAKGYWWNLRVVELDGGMCRIELERRG